MRLSLGITPKSYFNLAVPNDTDAQAFITAASITDGTQQSAVNQLVLDFKNANIWTKMKAIYPIVGGSASTHKWNLKDPRDLDAAFRLIYATGMTHSSTGMLGNGTSGFANTMFNTQTNFSSNNACISFYNRTNIGVGNGVIYGNSDNVTTYLPLTQFYPNLLGNTTSDIQDFNYRISVANSDKRGMYISTRSANNNFKLFKNNALFGSNTGIQPQTSFPNSNLTIDAFNYNGTTGNYLACEISFFSISTSLTDSEASNLHTAVNTYQTTLGRNV
jgi:hypothetical protein